MNKLMGMMTWLSWYKGKVDLYLYTLYHQPMWQKKIKVFFVKPHLKLFLWYCSPNPFICALVHDGSILPDNNPWYKAGGDFYSADMLILFWWRFYSTCLETYGLYFSNFHGRQKVLLSRLVCFNLELSNLPKIIRFRLHLWLNKDLMRPFCLHVIYKEEVKEI